jgi:hypothetical protein
LGRMPRQDGIGPARPALLAPTAQIANASLIDPNGGAKPDHILEQSLVRTEKPVWFIKQLDATSLGPILRDARRAKSAPSSSG